MLTVDSLIDRLRGHVTYTLQHEPEDIEIEDNASAVDPETDAKTYAWIRKELHAGNEWAWCHVTVTAHYAGFHGRDSLGACSYRSEEDFTTPGGYYDDMKGEALAELARTMLDAISRMGSALEKLGVNLCDD